MKLTFLQTRIEWQSPEENRRRFGDLIARAPASEVFLLPEMFATGFSTDAAAHAEEGGGETLRWMRQTAITHNAAIAGSVAVSEGGRNFNRFYFARPDGRTVACDKRHLFTMGGEKEAFYPGRERVIFEYMGLRIMPLVCYDLRFPVWSRAAGEVDLILYSANWPQPRIGAWDVLLRARAIENQCFVAGVNRTGSDPHGTYNGHSAVIDYLGQAIASGKSEEEAIVSAVISREGLDAFRTKFPAWMDADRFKIEE